MLRIRSNPHFQAEKRYSFEMLLGTHLGLPWEVQWDDQITHYQIELPNGKVLEIEDHFWAKIESEEYLKPQNLPQQSTTLPHPFQPGETLVVPFGRNHYLARAQQITCGADLFAAAFFMLSRWEEFVKPDRDQHGRFPAAAAWTVQQNYLHRPLVQEWAELLRQMLRQLGFTTPPAPTSQLLLSHDVDHPRLWWKPQDKWRTLAGSLLKRRNIREFRWWLNHSSDDRDPFDTFQYLMTMAEAAGTKACFNFMGRRATNSDCYYLLDAPFVGQIIQHIQERGHEIGFHPSYESVEQPELLKQELDSIAQISGTTPAGGRQHYLRFQAPETWERWEQAGLKWDSTLGFPEQPGFRCGTAIAFPVFNILKKQQLSLIEKPLLVMDVTLRQYLGLQPEAAIETIRTIKNQVRRYGGNFTLLWHNSSFNDFAWQGWASVFEETIQ